MRGTERPVDLAFASRRPRRTRKVVGAACSQGLLTLLVAVHGLGCVVGRVHAYHDTVVPLSYSGTARVAVVAYDQRPQVTSGAREEDYVGIMRGGFGNPFVVRTESGHALAGDFTFSACQSLASRGFKVVPVYVGATDPPEAVLAKLSAARGERAVLFAIRDWQSDTYYQTSLQYDVTVKVLDSRNAVLAEARIQGRTALGGSFWNPPSYAEEAVPQAFAQGLTLLLDDPRVAAALRAP